MNKQISIVHHLAFIIHLLVRIIHLFMNILHIIITIIIKNITKAKVAISEEEKAEEEAITIITEDKDLLETKVQEAKVFPRVFLTKEVMEVGRKGKRGEIDIIIMKEDQTIIIIIIKVNTTIIRTIIPTTTITLIIPIMYLLTIKTTL